MGTKDLWSMLSRSRVAVGITVVAFVFLVIHLLMPEVTFDSVTVTLLLIMALPWLGGWIKSIEVAGVKLELNRLWNEVTEGFQQQAKQQDAVMSRVEHVERMLAFSGLDVPDRKKERVTAVVRDFLAYMRACGARFGDEPSVEVIDKSAFGESAHYDVASNRLVVAASLIDETYAIRRECCFRIFHETLSDHEMRDAVSALAVEGRGYEIGALVAGLGFYFPCSFMNTSKYLMKNVPLMDLDRPEASMYAGYSSLSRRSRLSDPERLGLITATGSRWAHLLWALRTRVGREIMDPTIVATWNALNAPDAFDLGQAAFREELAKRLARAGAVAVEVEPLAARLLGHPVGHA